MTTAVDHDALAPADDDEDAATLVEPGGPGPAAMATGASGETGWAPIGSDVLGDSVARGDFLGGGAPIAGGLHATAMGAAC